MEDWFRWMDVLHSPPCPSPSLQSRPVQPCQRGQVLVLFVYGRYMGKWGLGGVRRLSSFALTFPWSRARNPTCQGACKLILPGSDQSLKTRPGWLLPADMSSIKTPWSPPGLGPGDVTSVLPCRPLSLFVCPSPTRPSCSMFLSLCQSASLYFNTFSFFRPCRNNPCHATSARHLVLNLLPSTTKMQYACPHRISGSQQHAEVRSRD